MKKNASPRSDSLGMIGTVHEFRYLRSLPEQSKKMNRDAATQYTPRERCCTHSSIALYEFMDPTRDGDVRARRQVALSACQSGSRAVLGLSISYVVFFASIEALNISFTTLTGNESKALSQDDLMCTP
jgi:hypothetical protein